jgi:hypothetical protein
MSGLSIENLEPFACEEKLNEGDSLLIFGHACALIKDSDMVLAYLSDDISVGGSQEMLIAKYYRKPLISLAPREGKFNKTIKVVKNERYREYLHPFVAVPSDSVVATLDEAAAVMAQFARQEPAIKTLEIIDRAVLYYAKTQTA